MFGFYVIEYFISGKRCSLLPGDYLRIFLENKLKKTTKNVFQVSFVSLEENLQSKSIEWFLYGGNFGV